VILGEGELREHLEKQVHEHHLEKHVLLPGFRTDVLGCIKAFDLFVMSSVTEGLGTSLLDAMACSRPIVATTTGGIPEIVEDGVNGSLVPPRDAAALAEAIVRALKNDGVRKRMGDAGLARVRQRFTVERMVQQTADVYKRVAPATSSSFMRLLTSNFRLASVLCFIPRWQIAKSYFTGSAGSRRRSDAVMSRAIRHPGLV
jgi:Glycosyltransferase